MVLSTRCWFYVGTSLLVAVRLTKNTDPWKYSYSGYGIGFDACWSFSLSDSSGFGKNVTIFGDNMSSSVHIGNKKERYLYSW